MNSTEELIWREGSKQPYTEYTATQWGEISKYVLEKLNASLEFSLAHESIESCIGNACFSIGVWTPRAHFGLLEVNCRGVVGGCLYNEDQNLGISASLFLYSKRKKMKLFSGADYIELVYAKTEGSQTGIWQVESWRNDEYSEFEGYNADFSSD